MDMINILTYLEKRQLGYSGLKKNTYDMFIEHLGYLPELHDFNANTAIGNIFACKFSRNKNNLHVIGSSSEHGEIIVQNTTSQFSFLNKQFVKSKVHDNAIFNFAWADPQMKLITACGDQTSKLFNLNPSGKLDEEREFLFRSSVKSVMFCPGSSDIFCGGCQDGSIKIWDARVHNSNSVTDFDRNIPNAHGIYDRCLRNSKNKKLGKVFGISSVIFKDDQTVISCSSMDPAIKFWDLRKSYRQVMGNTEPIPIIKYFRGTNVSQQNAGFTDMILNPQLTHLYACGINKVIYRFSLDSNEKKPICQYSGYDHETVYSKISISNDGRYLFSGCTNNTGVIWLTDFPYIEKPMFKMLNSLQNSIKELSTSDWCADPTCLKLVTSADSIPVVWSILTNEQRQSLDFKISRTSSYKSKPISEKMRTAPIKISTEQKEKLKKETEENMENWDIQNQSLVLNMDNLPLTPKNKPWEALFTKTTSPSSCQISPQLDSTSKQSSPVVTNHIPEVVTPTSSKKRKRSIISPRSLIDQYLVPSSKREKLDTVFEM